MLPRVGHKNLQKLSECRVGIWPTPYVSQSTAWFLLRVGTPTAALVFPISLLRDLWGTNKISHHHHQGGLHVFYFASIVS